jgi:SAM-dependent methyltransferase
LNKNYFELRDPVNNSPLKEKEDCLISIAGEKYPIINGIPRFVNSENYSADFGFQWNIFYKTQLDSYSGQDITERRLERCLRDKLTVLKGKKILEAGSGAGRFTEILLKYGAIVHSFDFSNAVEANAKNNGDNDNLILVQGDIRKIPFIKSNYDYVICLGVLQHTPSPEESMKFLFEMVCPGGVMVVDHYPWNWRIIMPTPIGESISLYRRIILLLPNSKKFKYVEKITKFWFPLHWKFRNFPNIQRILRRLSPVIFHYPTIKLKNKESHFEWSLLDTHDATTDYYKHRRTRKQMHKSIVDLGAIDIFVANDGNGVEGFCRKKNS